MGVTTKLALEWFKDAEVVYIKRFAFIPQKMHDGHWILFAPYYQESYKYEYYTFIDSSEINNIAYIKVRKLTVVDYMLKKLS
jgi:hypothetical protein